MTKEDIARIEEAVAELNAKKEEKHNFFIFKNVLEDIKDYLVSTKEDEIDADKDYTGKDEKFANIYSLVNINLNQINDRLTSLNNFIEGRTTAIISYAGVK